MKDISREEYDYAVFIVQSFHRQMDVKSGLSVGNGQQTVIVRSDEFSDISKAKINRADLYLLNLENIRTGDFILSLKTKSDHITKGMKYEVVGESGGAIRIKDDTGLIKPISRQNKFKLWSVCNDVSYLK